MFSKFKILNIKSDKIKKIPWFLGQNAFWIIILLILIESAAGEALFYKYALSIEKNEPKIINYNIKFKNNVYQKVLEEWQKKSQKFEQYQVEQYSNPFIAKKLKTSDVLAKETKINNSTNEPVIK